MGAVAGFMPLPATRRDLPTPLREPRGGSSPLIRILTSRISFLGAAVLAALLVSGGSSGSPGAGPTTEVVVTLSAPPLPRRLLSGASPVAYVHRLAVAQNAVVARLGRMLPAAVVRWRYHLVANGFAVVLPRSQLAALATVPGVAEVWPNVRYHALGATGADRAADAAGPQVVGASQLWGPNFDTAGNGMKIGIIDDGVDAQHPYFGSSGLTYPPGFPKGDVAAATPKVIVQRAFPPPNPSKYASRPFDPVNSFHATHVAGIAAGDYGANAQGTIVSGVAPNAYIGNYKALTTPTPGFGLDGNSAEIVAAIEAAVADGMDVINLSLGEPEVEPSRDIVVKAIDAAAAAGVVPVVAAGNDFDERGYGTVGSPANAPSAITVAASTGRGTIASFSSGGPTTLSRAMKPDVTAPGNGVLSSLPSREGTWGTLSGTSMATPHVAGAAAILAERHPDWTVAQIKSALVQTGVPLLAANGREESTTREGGGLIDAALADAPLVFATPATLSFGLLAPGAGASRTVELADAGGGAGSWSVTAAVQAGPGTLAAPSTVTVPGSLTVTATAGATSGDVTGFVVLSNGLKTRRIPVWFAADDPKLAGEPHTTLTAPGSYSSTTKGRPALVASYRYPTAGTAYAGPERAYTYTVVGRPANFGVVVLSGKAIPHVTIGADENHLAGYAGLPSDLNPYRDQFGDAVPVAGAVLPAAGTYNIVFDTVSAADAGPFTFRFWVNDTRPPVVHLQLRRGKLVFSARDAGSGVDPGSIVATVDGGRAKATLVDGLLMLRAKPGRHRVHLVVADYQEAKNMEDVAPILPNTTTVDMTVQVLRAKRS